MCNCFPFRCFFGVLIYFIHFINFAQSTSHSAYHPPLKTPLILSGNFGELRPNHFHMGIDFKTNGKIGLPIYAIEDGFVSRIKISPVGYGKVIYIDHPNGITSVYAHCSAFIGPIEAAIREVQIATHCNEVDYYFPPNSLLVVKGENIALSGNSGSSSGPHLHFELRNTLTEAALNPLKFGFEIKDTKAPQIKTVKLVAVDTKGYTIPNKSMLIPVKKSAKGYFITNNRIEIPADFCSTNGGQALSFEVSDFIDGTANPCSIYESQLQSNNERIFSQRLDSIKFEHTRYVNSHKDYAEYVKSKRKFSKSFKTANNPLTIYPNGNLGIITLQPGDSLPLTFSTKDIHQNIASLDFTLKAKKGVPNNLIQFYSPSSHFIPDSNYTFQGENYSIFIPAFSFYEPVQQNIHFSQSSLVIGSRQTPIQQPISIKLNPNKSQHPIEKKYIQCNESFLPTTVDSSNWLHAESKILGKFNIAIDTIPPTIQAVNFLEKDTIISKFNLHWKVTDTQTEITNYALYIDSNWTILEYDKKSSSLHAKLPSLNDGLHVLELFVIDSCQNTKKWQWTGYFSTIQKQ
jgi:murein DD-endopeptidase MepM/ murein hydrolase activator NlpD